MTVRTRPALTITAAVLLGGVVLANPAAAAEEEGPDALLSVVDEVLATAVPNEGPRNDMLMPVGEVLDVVDPAGVEQEGENEALAAPAGQDDVAEIPVAEPPAKKKRHGKR